MSSKISLLGIVDLKQEIITTIEIIPKNSQSILERIQEVIEEHPNSHLEFNQLEDSDLLRTKAKDYDCQAFKGGNGQTIKITRAIINIITENNPHTIYDILGVTKLSPRIPTCSQLSYFFEESLFKDTVLVYQGKELKVHRLVLAKMSGWFKGYYDHHPIRVGEVLRINIKENPMGLLFDIIPLLYGSLNSFRLSVTNICAVYKIAVFYRIPILQKITESHISQWEVPSNCLFFVSECIKYDILQEQFIGNILTIVAKEMVRVYFENGGYSELVFAPFFEKITNFKIFSLILRNQFASKPTKEENEIEKERQHVKFTEENYKLPTDDRENRFKLRGLMERKYFSMLNKIEIMERFVANRRPPNDVKDTLSMIVDWTDKNAYQNFVNYSCEWVSDEISKKILSDIIDRRRVTIKSFENDIKDCNQDTNRWFLYSWLNEISFASGVRTINEIDLISFFKNLGNSITNINPVDYGFINTKFSGKLSKDPKLLFQYDSFISLNLFEAKNLLPSFTIQIVGNVDFCISAVRLNASMIHKKPQINLTSFDAKDVKLNKYQPKPEIVTITVLDKNYKESFSNACKNSEPVIYFEMNGPCLGKVIKISTIKNENPQVLRIAAIQVFGKFSK